jgi:hypothetical protein
MYLNNTCSCGVYPHVGIVPNLSLRVSVSSWGDHSPSSDIARASLAIISHSLAVASHPS